MIIEPPESQFVHHKMLQKKKALLIISMKIREIWALEI
jgi:hypothetical protein